MYEDGEISLPDTTKLYNTDNYIAGVIGGVKQELIIAFAEVNFAGTAHTVLKEGGQIELTKITVMTEGIVHFTDANVDYELSLENFVVNTGGLVNAASLTVFVSDTFEMQEDSIIDLNERNEFKEGLGYENSVAGAGHGGQGGKGSAEEDADRGSANDEFINPVLMGSGGETTRGGGVLKVVANTLIIDGIIQAK